MICLLENGLFVGRRGRISWGRGDTEINSLGLSWLKNHDVLMRSQRRR
jgi:hypothetical protein